MANLYTDFDLFITFDGIYLRMNCTDKNICNMETIDRYLTSSGIKVYDKTTLQEKFQKIGKTFEYKTLDSKGQDHDKTFVVGLFVDGVQVITAEGKSKQLAEENCAKLYLSDV
jgi:dsRNA-specific ribonuclease